MHIAILDDSATDRRDLRQMLDVYFASCDTAVQISEFSGINAFLRAYIPGAFQIAFLDIYLDGENGMDAAREVYRIDPCCRLVFFTTSYDYAVDSYLVRAAYYLTKPVERGRLYDALEICCREPDNAVVELMVERVPVRLPLKDIYYVDCENRNLRLHLADRTLGVSGSFAEVSEVLLSDGRFLICNRGILVNMDHIQQAPEGGFLLKNNVEVPIRIRGRREIKKIWMTYSLRSLGRGHRDDEN